ncbi:hypothetical protein RLOC_00008596 [Lonchura striata]|uniref:Uncharacterized protein n=1 Tax=Lonchura striata TaxID=40157 RepID=A0A218UAE4_9PASE|nr:hypothetical protein RLOC_00008596 [Lonchura striata domestica]
MKNLINAAASALQVGYNSNHYFTQPNSLSFQGWMESCKSVAVPGNSRNDTVCSDSGTATVLPHTVLNLLLTQSSASHKPEIVTRAVTLNSVPDLSHITGAVAGPLLLVFIIAILGYCVVSKKKALVYSAAATEADLNILVVEERR